MISTHLESVLKLQDGELPRTVKAMQEIASKNKRVDGCVHGVDPARRNDERVARLETEKKN